MTLQTLEEENLMVHKKLKTSLQNFLKRVEQETLISNKTLYIHQSLTYFNSMYTNIKSISSFIMQNSQHCLGLNLCIWFLLHPNIASL